MPLSPQVKSFLDMLAGLGGPPLEQLPVSEARAVALEMVDFGGPEEPVGEVVNRDVPGPAGPIAVRVYRPVLRETLPALVYLHGGGYVIGNLDTHDRPCRSLANASGCAVIAVDYRLAPEHKYPAAVDDAYAATGYIAEHAAEFGIDPNRIAVGGDSAGGNLATVVCLLSRDRGGPRLKYQLLIYPWVNFHDQSPSMQQYAKDHFLTRDGLDWFMENYLPSREAGLEPSASPMNATNFRGLPPALIITAECDPLRDQGEAYARKLQTEGVQVELKRYEGMIHPFFNLAGAIDTAKVAIADAGSALRAALGTAVSHSTT
ncbi:MAG: alpha/beta hydrolase [Acidobacteriia bacterium]|nr:alpha/beta hydrolase [Terriglobia bacterium]